MNVLIEPYIFYTPKFCEFQMFYFFFFLFGLDYGPMHEPDNPHLPAKRDKMIGEFLILPLFCKIKWGQFINNTNLE